CSSGVLTSCSTSRALAPSNGTITLAMVTSICGSSSRGVTSTATRPSSKPSKASTGVSGLAWNAAARRPGRPRRGISVITGTGGVALGDERLHRDDRVGGDRLALAQAGNDLDVVATACANAQLAQR